MTSRAVIVAAAGAMLMGASAPPVERVVTGDGVVAVTVNGVQGRLRIDPGAPGLPLLTPEFAERAGLKGGGLLSFGVNYRVGPQSVSGRTQVARISFGRTPAKQRLAWTARPYASGVDAVAGPAGLDEPVVRFMLRTPQAGERTATLPMAKMGGLFASWFGSYAEITVGGAPMLVRFDPHHARTVANASAATRLAAAFGGRLEGLAGEQEIAFGIERPVRGMVLARPVPIGPLSLGALAVRTADGGSVASIPDAAAARVPAADPDEVVVTARGKKHDPRRDQLTLGADQLDRCSSIVFDKPARQIRLSCLA